MKKTGGEIEKDLYTLIKNSAVKTAITGSLYRQGMRPINSLTEDAVVSFLAGIDGDIQEGVLNLNIYVPNIEVSGQKVKNITRCTELEVIVNTFIQSLIAGEYVFELDKMIQTFQEAVIEQHFINCRIKFRLSTY